MSKRILFVRSGGGMPGLDIHAGITLALDDAGIRPTETSGTSAGAIICAMEASGRTPANMAAIMAGMRDDQVRHERTCWKVRIPWIDSVMDNDRIRATMEQYISPTWDALSNPFHAWAVDESNGTVADVADPAIAPTPVDAALASMSIAGLFPPVVLNATPYIDGGVRRNLPLLPNWTEFDQVWLLIATQRMKPGKHSGIISRLILNFNIALFDQTIEVVEAMVPFARKVHVVWPACPSEAGLLHFNHGLIAKAYDQTVEAIHQIKREETPV
jgi:predicted acylesterase/phospholipase RssA